MVKGSENLEKLGEDITLLLHPCIADEIREQAILGGMEPGEVVRRAVGLYIEHTRLTDEGYQAVYTKPQGRVRRVLAFMKLTSSEVITIRFRDETTTPA